MKLEDFDYSLPKELIAQNPLSRREDSRLLVLHRKNGKIEHRTFKDIVRYLEDGDCLVLNETKVIPARILGGCGRTGKTHELLLVRKLSGTLWTTLLNPSRGVSAGTEFHVGDDKTIVTIAGKQPDGGFLVRTSEDGLIDRVLTLYGHVPLPPYIRRPDTEEDRTTYQTVYARKEGSVAAPTAGLHFTRELLDEISAKGVRVAKLVLHIGPGTFTPVRTKQIEDHVLHEEYFELSSTASSIINETMSRGGRVFAVGTSVVRVLEERAGIFHADGEIRRDVFSERAVPSGVEAGEGSTRFFIHPPFEFKVVDSMVTNFHLPKSTLLMLVSAFAGREKILDAYAAAVGMKYRFYSYGDAMLIT